MRNTYTETDILIETTEKRMNADRVPVPVTVTLISDGDPPVYTMTTDGPISISTINADGVDEYELTFNNYQNGTYSDGFEVTFNFIDNTNKDYGFFFDPSKPKADTAIWVKKIDETGTCPTGPSKWAGFNPTSVSRTTLVVVNPNSHLQYFGFALLLSRKGETAWSKKLDPVGNNMNGTTSRF
jgi:hypothetical protein